MRRTQIYLTDEEHSAASAIARSQERTLSDVIREALDSYIASEMPREERLRRMHAARGMWKDRDDLPDFEEIRRSWDRDVWNADPR